MKPPIAGLTGEAVRFILVGIAATATDLLVYTALFALAGAPYAVAKAASFLMGAIVSYNGHKSWTFNALGGWAIQLRFAGLYGATLGLNVASNEVLIRWLGEAPWAIATAFLIATGLAASSNFLGLRLVVFTRKPTVPAPMASPPPAATSPQAGDAQSPRT